jgi:hypothetical protein
MKTIEEYRQEIKRSLLLKGCVGRVYRRLRGKQIELRYKWWNARYNVIGVRDQAEIIRSRSGDRLKAYERTEKPRILFLGTDESQDRSGLIQALERSFDLTVFTSARGEYGWTRGSAPLSIRAENGQRLLQLLDGAKKINREYNLVIGQMWGGLHPEDIIASAHAQHSALFVNICMDDRHAFGPVWRAGVRIGTKYLDPCMDLVLTAAPECVSWHNSCGCPAVFFPEASDPEIFRPLLNGKKTIDVLFVGQRYGRRGQLIEWLTRSGIHVEAFGEGWPNGRLKLEDTPGMFASAKILLGHSGIAYCRELKALKLRDFDGPMSGSFYLTEANTDLQLMYRIPQEIDVYSDYDSCLEKCLYYLTHDLERESIAAQGRIKAISCHTWDDRISWLKAFLDAAANGLQVHEFQMYRHSVKL